MSPRPICSNDPCKSRARKESKYCSDRCRSQKAKRSATKRKQASREKTAAEVYRAKTMVWHRKLRELEEDYQCAIINNVRMAFHLKRRGVEIPSSAELEELYPVKRYVDLSDVPPDGITQERFDKMRRLWEAAIRRTNR